MKLFNFVYKKNKKKELIKDNYNLKNDKYFEIGKLVKEARIKNNFSIKELSEASKIPVNTIKAIENNINELRPKYPFIRSILLKLEKCLLLDKNSLVGLIISEKNSFKNNKNNFIIRKFDFINSWQGSVIYFLILISTLFILNRYFISDINIIEIKFIEGKTNEK